MIDVANKLKSFVDGKNGIDSLLTMAGGGLGLGGLSGAPAESRTSRKHRSRFTSQTMARIARARGSRRCGRGTCTASRSQHESARHCDSHLRFRGIADQSLSLVAEIPILDAWIKDKRELAALKGQSIQIPITGSVTQPRLDTRGLVTFGKNFAFQAGRGMIDEQLRGGLEKGTSAVQSEVGKVQNKITEEVQKGKQKIESELRDSLKGIFGS